MCDPGGEKDDVALIGHINVPINPCLEVSEVRSISVFCEPTMNLGAAGKEPGQCRSGWRDVQDVLVPDRPTSRMFLKEREVATVRPEKPEPHAAVVADDKIDEAFKIGCRLQDLLRQF
jgi:hypothetical protein